MKEDILDVLMYLFEHYLEDEDIEQIDYDQDTLRSELTQAGFHGGQITKALDWLESLAMQQDEDTLTRHSRSAIRVYAPAECERLDVECRGFLLFLEQVGVLEPASRELVIDRAMALDTDEFSLEQLKWVILMVLFNQPGQEAAFAWMEDLVYEEMVGIRH